MRAKPDDQDAATNPLTPVSAAPPNIFVMLASMCGKSLGEKAMKHTLAIIVVINAQTVGVCTLLLSLPLAYLCYMCGSIAWTRFVFWYVKYQEIIQAGGSCSMVDPAFGAGITAYDNTNADVDVFKGTPWYIIIAQLIGLNIHSEAIVFAPLSGMLEIHLIHVGKCLLDWDVKVVPHYVKNGRFYFDTTSVDDGAWVQAQCRVMIPDKLHNNSRILPASMVLPHERIMEGTIWGGIPAAPVASVLPPSVRQRYAELSRRVPSRRGSLRSQGSLSQRQLQSVSSRQLQKAKDVENL